MLASRFCLSTVFAYDWSINPGTGDPNTPYQISTPEQLISIGSNAALLDKDFILTNDIIFDSFNNPDHNFTAAPIAPDTDTSQGFQGIPFTGTFDGGGHTIFYLEFKGGSTLDYAGLFGYAENAVIRNINLESLRFMFVGSYAGGLVGRQSGGFITNCSCTGTISSDNCAAGGGIAGMVENGSMADCRSQVSFDCYSYSDSCSGGLVGLMTGGSIINCRNTGSITCSSDYSFAGGIAGLQYSSSVSNCYNTGAITCYGINVACAGGIAGEQHVSSISNCRNTGKITCNFSDSSYVGGIAGSQRIRCSIDNCCSTADVTSFFTNIAYVGGLAGYQNGHLPGNSISNSYSMGTVTCSYSDDSFAGGLVGYLIRVHIQKCYSASHVTGATYTGGFSGNYGSGPLEDCFWDTQTNGTAIGVGNGSSSSSGVYGRTTEQMQQQATFTDYGWDFADDGTDKLNNFWRMCEDGTDYPRLSWEMGQAGDFTCPDGVGMGDLEALTVHWLTENTDPNFNYACDGSGDGRINQQDMEILSRFWKE